MTKGMTVITKIFIESSRRSAGRFWIRALPMLVRPMSERKLRNTIGVINHKSSLRHSLFVNTLEVASWVVITTDEPEGVSVFSRVFEP